MDAWVGTSGWTYGHWRDRVYPHALPQYNLGHSEHLAGIARLRNQLPGLWLAGNYLRGPSVGACVEQAMSVAQEVASRLEP